MLIHSLAYAIGIWGIAAICGPVLGPLIGGFAAQHKGWQCKSHFLGVLLLFGVGSISSSIQTAPGTFYFPNCMKELC